MSKLCVKKMRAAMNGNTSGMDDAQIDVEQVSWTLAGLKTGFSVSHLS